MNNVVDLNSVRKRSKPKDPESLIMDEAEATEFAVMMAADMVDFLENMGLNLTLDSNPNSMREVYMIIDNIKALILRMQNMDCATHKINDSYVGFIDVDEHLKRFRTILEED